MKKRMLISAVFCLMMVGALLIVTQAFAAGHKGRGSGPIIYVTGQELFYDSIVTADPLPPKGPFQLLEEAGPSGLQTEFGLGDTEYVGGRWWMDTNPNGEMDDDDHYFSCPLLGPGREDQ
jgi:hypothetical protein